MLHTLTLEMSVSPLARIYKLKVVIVAILVACGGFGTMFLAYWLEEKQLTPHFLIAMLDGLADAFLVAGLLGIAIDFWTQRDKEARDDARVRRLLADSAPDFTDAVVRGFASSPDDLKRVATPGLLDDLATNALGLRLGDPGFAREIYSDLRDMVVSASERWYDVDVRIRLSSIDESSTAGVPRFVVTVTWEYSVIPSSPVQRFACTSDRDEFHELVSDIPSTSTWYMTPRPGFDASSRDAFELLQFSVDGEEKKIRRSARKTGQTYFVAIGDDAVRDGRMVRIRHVYRTITPRSGHRLYVAIAQPTKGLSLTMDYTDTDIAHMSVTDLVSAAQRPHISRLPEQTAAREISLDVPGWLLPKAEVTFVWTLASEVSSADAGSASAAIAA
ncbi:hypothetical protein [Rathayibacter rathayi]|uniref:hypothetical protein n=1 Tax=Rathayibacter rathayi TaxID=33887 RepID=UPI000D4018F7|nr:hypothetical protein [Rathayibacter rathayi]PPG90705.1 hypothetical protein C5C47_00920 [Rathayibacter rathayi]